MEIARKAYLDEILFAKKNTKERYEVVSFIELAQRMSPEQMVTHLNGHLAMKMFLVGLNITAADIIVHLYIADYFKDLPDHEKIANSHVFRWVDHI